MKIGLIGEAPNDTQSIKNLLEKKYSSEKYIFVFMLNNINGDKLGWQKVKGLLRKEYQSQKPDFLIFIRDLDSILPNKIKRKEKKEYFTEFNSVVNKKGIFLLHIYEIEALILTDVALFNKEYGADLQEFEYVMKVSEPKEYLKKASKKYNESHNPEIFKLIDFEKTLNCGYFKKFIKDFDKLIS